VYSPFISRPTALSFAVGLVAVAHFAHNEMKLKFLVFIKALLIMSVLMLQLIIIHFTSF
jgi:hypothetical protein